MSANTGLLLAVFAVSWASIFIRWCGDTPALVISFYRMFWSTIILVLYQLKTDAVKLRYYNLDSHCKRLIGLAGIFLALHFGTWIASIQLTTISHSLILESTHPVFALLLSPLFLKEKGSWRSAVAALLTLSGIIIIGGQDMTSAGSKFEGDLLAVVSAFFVTFYIFIARYLRNKIDIIPYLIAVYFSATVTLMILIFVSGDHVFNYPLRVHFLMFLIAVVPTGIGHSLINWAARKVAAYKVNFSILGEPVIASVLAYVIFSEKPYGLFYLGAVFILTGIVIAQLDHMKDKRKVPV